MENASLPTDGVVAKKKPAFVKWALVLGIAIVTNLFISYVVQVLYPEPLYNDFCPESQVNKVIETEKACLEVGGQWNEGSMKEVVNQQGVTLPQVSSYCNVYFTCSKQFDDAHALYNRNVFMVFIVAGILLLLGSVFLIGSETVSLALSFGGILALIVGSVRYWSDMDDILRVVILGVALAGLVYVAWKKFRD